MYSGACLFVQYEVMNTEVDYTPYEGVEPPSEKVLRDLYAHKT